MNTVTSKDQKVIACCDLVPAQVQQKEAPATASACCGGQPDANEEACCKLDEEVKAEGLSSCGCGTDKDIRIQQATLVAVQAEAPAVCC